jgi:hypothetical protein
MHPSAVVDRGLCIVLTVASGIVVFAAEAACQGEHLGRQVHSASSALDAGVLPLHANGTGGARHTETRAQLTPHSVIK